MNKKDFEKKWLKTFFCMNKINNFSLEDLFLTKNELDYYVNEDAINEFKIPTKSPLHSTSG